MKNIFSNYKKRAFTLVELLVTISIIGILATLIGINLTGAQAKSRDTKRKSDLSMIMSAMVMYASDHGGEFPATDGSIYSTSNATDPTVCQLDGEGHVIEAVHCNLHATLVQYGYIERLPNDPKATNTDVYTGYAYYRANYGDASATNRKGYLYASLEKPSDDDLATGSSSKKPDSYIWNIHQTGTPSGVLVNFRLGN